MLTSGLSFASNQYEEYAKKYFQDWLNSNSAFSYRLSLHPK